MQVCNYFKWELKPDSYAWPKYRGKVADGVYKLVLASFIGCDQGQLSLLMSLSSPSFIFTHSSCGSFFALRGMTQKNIMEVSSGPSHLPRARLSRLWFSCHILLLQYDCLGAFGLNFPDMPLDINVY